MSTTPMKIQIVVDDDGSVKVQKFGREAEKAARKGATSFRKTGKSLDEMNMRAVTATKHILALSTLLASLATGAAIAGLLKLVNTASDLEETASKFNVVFEGQIAQAEAWVKVLVDAYAMSTREAKLYLSSVQDLLVPMGMQAQAAGKLSNEIVKLSADLGSFNNLPTAQVMDDIQSALVGNYETMKKYGVVLNATLVQEKALAMGLADTKDALTAADKAQAAYKLMVEGSTAAIGDMARTSGSYANQVKKLQANIEDLQAMLGNELLPVATKVVKAMNDWVKANDELIGQKVDEAVVKITSALKSAVDIYNNLPDGVIGAAGMGIVGRILLGGPKGWLLGALPLLNAQIEKLSQNLSGQGLKENYKEFLMINAGLADIFGGGKPGGGAGGSFEDVADTIIDVDESLIKTLPTLTVTGKKFEEMGEVMALTAKEVEALEDAIKRIEASVRDKEIASAWKAQDMADWVRAGNQAVQDMEREFGEYMEGVYRDIKATHEDVVVDVAETTDAVYDLWMRAMNRVEEGIADAFYNAFTGQFDSIEDGFKGLLDSMLRMFAEWAAAASMFDIFGVGDGKASFGSLFGGSGKGGSGGGLFDWISTGFSVGKGGYELYTGNSLMGQVYNFLSEAVASIFATEVGSAYVGMYAGTTMAEVEAMVSAELASIGIGEGAAAGSGAASMSTAAYAGIAAAAVAAIIGGSLIFENNTRPDANITAAFGAGISNDQNRLFDVEFLSILGNQGFDQADAETQIHSLVNAVSDTFMGFEKIWTLLSKESQAALKDSLKTINWDEFVISIRAWAKEGGPLDVLGIFGEPGFKDFMRRGAPYEGGPVTTPEGGDDFWNWFYTRIGMAPGQDVTKAGDPTAVMWDIMHEYFEPYIAEAVGGLKSMEVFSVMTDEIKASIDALLTDEAWSGGVDAYFQSFSDGIDKITHAAGLYADFNRLIEGAATEYTVADRAIADATASTAGFVSVLESLGMELSEEDIQEIASNWAALYGGMADDMGAVAAQATAADQAIATLTGQFEAYWQQMVEAGIDVTTLGDKTALLDDAIQHLIDTMQTAVWDEINKSVKAMMTEMGNIEGTVGSLITSFTAMWNALVQVNAAAEDFAALQSMALDVMKYQMGLGGGTDRAAQIQSRYGRYGLSYQQMIDAFANMDLDGLMAIADELNINWWEIAQDVAWMMDQMDDAGETAAKVGTEFANLRSQIESTLSGVSGSFGGGESADMIMSQIVGMRGIPMSEMTGDTLLSMSEKLVQWYNAAVAEAQAAAREEQEAARLLEQVADRISSLVTQIDTTIRSVKYSGLNVSLPYQKAAAADADYDTLLAAANAGGTAEIQEYLGFVQTYLQQQQNEWKSSSAYQQKYQSVMDDMAIVKARAEAGGYDQQILAELQSAHEDIDVDLTAIQATFSEFEGWILNALQTLEDLSIVLNIDWNNYDPTIAEALHDLMLLVKTYGWDHTYTLNFLANVPLDMFENLNQLATAAGWVADQSGGWNSTATIAFLKNVAQNWEFDNLNQILAAIGYVKEQAGGWGAEATVSFVMALLDENGGSLSNLPFWLDYMGLTDAESMDFYVTYFASLLDPDEDPITQINTWLQSLGLEDTTYESKLRVRLVYEFYQSGAMTLADVANHVHNMAVAAYDAPAYDPVAKGLVEQIQGLGELFGYNSAQPLGYAVGIYSGRGGDGGLWPLMMTRQGMPYQWAEGTVAYGPQLGWIGEAGYPEAVIPMKDGHSIPVKWMNGGRADDKGETVINLTVITDGVPKKEVIRIAREEADEIRVYANTHPGNEYRRVV